MNKWICVKNALPPVSEDCLLFIKQYRSDSGHFWESHIVHGFWSDEFDEERIGFFVNNYTFALIGDPENKLDGVCEYEFISDNKYIEILYWMKLPDKPEADMTDLVNHPPHYNNSPAHCECGRRIECIDITRHMSFNIGNAVKYLWRFQDKNGIEDLKKARWYLEDVINQLEQRNRKQMENSEHALDSLKYIDPSFVNCAKDQKCQ